MKGLSLKKENTNTVPTIFFTVFSIQLQKEKMTRHTNWQNKEEKDSRKQQSPGNSYIHIYNRWKHGKLFQRTGIYKKNQMGILKPIAAPSLPVYLRGPQPSLYLRITKHYYGPVMLCRGCYMQPGSRIIIPLFSCS